MYCFLQVQNKVGIFLLLFILSTSLLIASLVIPDLMAPPQSKKVDSHRQLNMEGKMMSHTAIYISPRWVKIELW